MQMLSFLPITIFVLISFTNATLRSDNEPVCESTSCILHNVGSPPRVTPEIRSNTVPSLVFNCAPDDILCIQEMAEPKKIRPQVRMTETSSTFESCVLDQSAESNCPSGTVCSLSSTGLRCLVPHQEGDTCIAAASKQCVKGSECINSICTKVKRDGESCNLLSQTDACVTGTFCVGRINQKRCVKPMSLGGSCGIDPYWICDKGYTCRYYKCVRKASLDCPCSDINDTCERNTVCTLISADSNLRCATLRRPDVKEWAFVSTNGKAKIYLNGLEIGESDGWNNFAAVPVKLDMGGILALKISGASGWSGFIAAVGAYQVGKPNWSIRSGAHEFIAIKSFNDADDAWTKRDYNPCTSNEKWLRVMYAPRDSEINVGEGKSQHFPYWTGARYMWARDVSDGEVIYVIFKRGGHECKFTPEAKQPLR